MSIVSALTHLWSHKPTQQQLSTVDELLKKASTLIEFLEAHLPDDADRQAAVNAVNQAVMHSHAALAHLAKREASDASDAEATSKAEAASQATS